MGLTIEIMKVRRYEEHGEMIKQKHQREHLCSKQQQCFSFQCTWATLTKLLIKVI